MTSVETPRPGLPASTARALVAAVTVAAFVVRLAVRLYGGEEAYRRGSYDFYRIIAQTFVDGHGLCVGPGAQCGLRLPLYPLVLSPFVATGTLYPWLVVLHAVLGAAIVWCAWDAARRLFSERAGLLAALFAAVSPYAAVHDTALQDTVVVNLAVAAAFALLVRASKAETRLGLWGWGGVALAAAVMTTARVALFLPAALAWTLLRRRDTPGLALRQALCVALPSVLLLGGWMARNWAVVGAPVVTTESGESFWVANGPWTFEFLPDRSIDRVVDQSYARLDEKRGRQLAALQGGAVATDRLLQQWGWEYVRAHPLGVLVGATRKVWSAASARLSPARAGIESLGYTAFFAPVHLFALFGLWRTRRRIDDSIGVFLQAGFVATTAVYWAHTSHKSVIDAVLFVYAAGAIVELRAVVSARISRTQAR